MGDISTTDTFGLIGLTYGGVFLPLELTDVVPSTVDTTSRLTKEISLRVPPFLIAIDTTTGARMAIAMARQGGIGILHHNLSIEGQAQQMRLVKHSESGMMEDLATIGSGATIEQLGELCGHCHASGLPVVSEDGHLFDIITNRDLRFVPQSDQARPKVRDCTTPHERLVTGHVGTSHEDVKALLAERRVKKLPITDEDDRLAGLITVKDFVKAEQYPNAAKGAHGRLIIGVTVRYWSDTWERATALAEAGVDVLVADTVNGGVKLALDTIRRIKNDPTFDGIEIIGGSVVTTEDTQALVSAGVSAVKVEVGLGPIHMAHVVADVGAPQITAVAPAAKACGPTGAPLIVDGRFQYSGDIGKTPITDADTVMLGSLLTGREESFGGVAFINGKQLRCYRGIGSFGAMSSRGRRFYSKDHYSQTDVTSGGKTVPEGTRRQMPFTGSLVSVIYQLVGGLHQTVLYLGASSTEEIKKNDHFVRITSAGLHESRPYDVQMASEASNYHSISGR